MGIFKAIYEGPDAVRDVLAQGDNVNRRNTYGRTPLHDAEEAEIAQVLIEHGADVNARDPNGRTPLHEAKYYELAEVLLRNGADANAKDHFGRTPLHMVENMAIAMLLFGHGANVHATCQTSGQTPFHSVQEDMELALLLLDHGVDVNAQDGDGRTRLHYAVDEAFAQALLDRGADPLIRDNKGQTAHDTNELPCVKAAYEKAVIQQTLRESAAAQASPSTPSEARVEAAPAMKRGRRM